MPSHGQVALVIPTLNAASDWHALVGAIQSQERPPDQVLIVDSESTDCTLALAHASQFLSAKISRASFNHGGTRQWAVQHMKDAEIVVFLTQDAILASPDSLEALLRTFDDPLVGAAFGRQLPRNGANAIEAHARLFNYPMDSSVRAFESRETLGFKAIFISNSFAAYRRRALEAVGGFPPDVILGEDTITAAHLLMKGWRIAYAADAQVYHSHAYSWLQEFRRYFDTGVLHARESWLLDEFGRTGGEGRRLVASELAYLWAHDRALIPSAMIRTVLKWTGYRLGRFESHLSLGMKRRLSMHHRFWR
jgi:rhamnosyltransferase